MQGVETRNAVERLLKIMESGYRARAFGLVRANATQRHHVLDTGRFNCVSNRITHSILIGAIVLAGHTRRDHCIDRLRTRERLRQRCRIIHITHKWLCSSRSKRLESISTPTNHTHVLVSIEELCCSDTSGIAACAGDNVHDCLRKLMSDLIISKSALSLRNNFVTPSQPVPSLCSVVCSAIKQ